MTDTTARSDTPVAWGFVVAQAVLLLALVFAPTGELWPRPAVLGALAAVLVVVGLGLIAVAALQLRSTLTPLPTPVEHGTLSTGGVYRLCRHPIYLGVLVLCVGLTLRRASAPALAVLVALVVFFHVKGAWEERRLAARYPDYAAYAARVPRIMPLPRPNGHPTEKSA